MSNRLFFPVVCAAIFLTLGQTARAAGPTAAEDITVVLVHGAYAESSTWNEVIPKLAARGYRAVAVANPLRGLKTDSEYVGTVLGRSKFRSYWWVSPTAGRSSPTPLVGTRT